MLRTIIIFTVAMAAIVVPASTSALTVNRGQSIFVESTATEKGVYAAGGGTVDLAGTFEDDVIVAGGTVTASGPMNGDLFVAGGTVKVTGEVKGSVRVGAGTVDLEGKVGRNLLVFGGTVTVGKSAEIVGETLLFAGSLVFEGHAMKAMNGWGGSFAMNGRADGDVEFRTGDDCGTSPCVSVGPDAVIGGNLTYWASKDAAIDSKAKISGTVTRKDLSEVTGRTKAVFGRFLTLARLWNLFSLLVVATLIGLFLPRTVRNVGETMMRRTGAAVGWGVLLFLATPVAILLLPLTIIGIPLAIILLALYLLGLYVSQVFLGFLVGSWILRSVRRGQAEPSAKPVRPVWPMLLGLVIISLVFDFLFGVSGVTNGSLVFDFIIGTIRLFLMLWPFGALVLVKWQVMKEREQ